MTSAPVVAIFEVDPNNERATGHVHPFCSEKCRDKFEVPAPMSAEHGESPADWWGDDTICDECDRPIFGTPDCDIDDYEETA